MIEVIHEHSVDMSLLPEKATILDLGVRGFEFCNHFRELGHTVHAVDIDDLQHGDYDQCAITNFTGFCGISRNSDPQATKIGEGDSIRCYTLEDYMKWKGVEFFDLIKSDCEGEEVRIIASMTKAPARMISVEWHLHTGQTKEQVALSVEKLQQLGYKIATHELSEMHGSGLNFWSSLFILK